MPIHMSAHNPNKVKGCILGFAIGDALGAPREFLKDSPLVSKFEPAQRKGLRLGQFTDDTQLLEMGMDSLLAAQGEIDLQDHADRLIDWYKSGIARSMGRTTELAIQNLMNCIPYTQSGIDHINACGSLALARLLPYAIFSAINRSPYKMSQLDIRNILKVTHAHKKVYDMGRLVSYFIQEIANGKSPKETLDMILFERKFLNRSIRKKLGMVKDLSESSNEGYAAIQEIGESGFIEDVVFSSLYGSLKGGSFEEAVLISANGGGDTDSRAAFTGAFYGLDVGIQNIPRLLRHGLERSSELEKKAADLYYLRR